MGFESIFSKSWNEFKNNWTLALKAGFWFGVLPVVILLIIGFGIAIAAIGSFFQGFTNMNNLTAVNESSGALFNNFLAMTGNAVSDSVSGSVGIVGLVILFSLLIFVVFVLMIICYLIFFYISIYNEKGGMKLGPAFRGSIKYFWKFVGLTLLFILIFWGIFLASFVLGILFYSVFKQVLALAILFIVLLIICAIVLVYYLMIKWYFAPFILMRENKGAKESMKLSSAIVRGRWWKTFAYILLIMLISFGIYMVASFALQLSFLIFMPILILSAAGGIAMIGIVFLIFFAIVMVVFVLFYSLIAILMLLLLKNLYLELRTGKIYKK